MKQIYFKKNGTQEKSLTFIIYIPKYTANEKKNKLSIYKDYIRDTLCDESFTKQLPDKSYRH